MDFLNVRLAGDKRLQQIKCCIHSNQHAREKHKKGVLLKICPAEIYAKDTGQQEDQDNTSVMTMAKKDVAFVAYFFIGMARTVLVVI